MDHYNLTIQHRYFKDFILFLIFINTIVMGIQTGLYKHSVMLEF